MVYSDKQKRVLREADARWNILHGAVRSGKSFISSDLLVKRVHQQPRGNCLMVGKTEGTLTRNVIHPLQDRWGSKYISDISGSSGSRELRIFGRKFYVIGANDERSVKKLQGMGLIYAYGDEITTWPQSFFEMLKSRLDKKGAKFDGSCNPEGPFHWLKTGVLENEEMNRKEWHFTLDDGKDFLDPDFISELKKEYVGVWYKRYIDGLWVMAEGVIYDMWRDETNVIDELDFNPVKYYCSLDYGTNNPFVAGLFGVKGNQARLIKEYYYASNKQGRQKTDAEYSKDLANFLDGYNVRNIYIDPSATSFNAQLRADGFSNVRNANNAVVDGIKTVSKKISDGSYKVLSSCQNTIKEKSTYVWDNRAQQRGEDKPLKENDHCCDMERYFLHTQFGRMKVGAAKAF